MDYLKLIGFNPAAGLLKFLKDHALSIIAIGLLIAGGVLFYLDYSETKAGLAKANTQIALYQKKIDEQAATIKDLQEKLVLASKSNDISNEAETKINEEEKKVDREQAQRQRVVEKKIIKIKDDPKLSEKEKQDTASSVYIDDLWEGFCSRPENKEREECAPFHAGQPGLTLKPTNDLPSVQLNNGE